MLWGAQVLEQTKQVQADTMAELDTQKKQVNRLNDKLTKVSHLCSPGPAAAE